MLTQTTRFSLSSRVLALIAVCVAFASACAHASVSIGGSVHISSASSMIAVSSGSNQTVSEPSDSTKTLFQTSSGRLIRQPESWYLMWGFGAASNGYPEKLDDFLSKSNMSSLGWSSSGLGFYVPFWNEKTILGINFSGSSSSYTFDDNGRSIDVYISSNLMSVSLLHWFNVETGGRGMFVRADAGIATLTSDYFDYDTVLGVHNERFINGAGIGCIGGVGYSTPTPSGRASLLIEANLSLRLIGSEYEDFSGLYSSFAVNVAALW
ncbi:MAG: hypothetical protein ABIH86_04040 [Planctomycetota bacterium]